MHNGVPVTLIAALARNHAIGLDGGMPWRLPEDLKRFRAVTMGHPMVMGRTTFQAIGRVLPGRPHVVMTRDAAFAHDGVDVAHSLNDALAKAAAHETGRIMVIGGAKVYAQAMDAADELDVCAIHKAVEGDAFFPVIDPAVWRETSREAHGPNADGISFDFVRYERR